MADGVSGKGVALALAGAILSYSAIRNKRISTTIRDLIAGKNPSTDPNADLPSSNPYAVPGYTAPIDPRNPASFGGVAGNPNTKLTPKGLDATAIYKVARQAGFNPFGATIMTAIALAESSGDPGSINNNPSTGDLSYGLWQINMIGAMGPQRLKDFGITTNNQLLDPLTNAKAAYKISHGGMVFTDWSTFTQGSPPAYQQYLGIASAASHKVDG